MNPRSSVRRWLACILMILCWMQLAVVAVHLPVPSDDGAAQSGDAGDRSHDPTTCQLCHVISQLRAQSGPASSLSIALLGETIFVVPNVAIEAPRQVTSLGPNSRAPPSAPIV